MSSKPSLESAGGDICSFTSSLANPLVSVIIPTYNRADSIERAVLSVLVQSYQNYELVVVDDGSTDDTASLLAPFLEQGQLKVIHQKQQGVAAARNRGVAEAAGDWLAFLDSDDEWLPEKLEKQVNAVLSSSLPWAHTDEIWVRDGVRVNQRKHHAKSGGDILMRCLELCCVGPSTVLISKDFFLKHKGFREDYPVCEDYELWLRLAADSEISHISEPLMVKYGGHSDQLSTTYKAMDYYRIKAIDELLDSGVITERSESVEYAVSLIVKKAEILIKGFVKHNNLSRLAEVKSLMSKWGEFSMKGLRS